MAGLPTDRDNENRSSLRYASTRPKRAHRHCGVGNLPYRQHPGVSSLTALGTWYTDINSPSEATCIISRLMRWTDEADTYPYYPAKQGGRKRKGAYRYGVNNKAETVLLVEKDEKDTDMARYGRHISENGLRAFASASTEGVAELLDGYKFQKKSRERPKRSSMLIGTLPNTSTHCLGQLSH